MLKRWDTTSSSGSLTFSQHLYFNCFSACQAPPQLRDGAVRWQSFINEDSLAEFFYLTIRSPLLATPSCSYKFAHRLGLPIVCRVAKNVREACGSFDNIPGFEILDEADQTLFEAVFADALVRFPSLPLIHGSGSMAFTIHPYSATAFLALTYIAAERKRCQGCSERSQNQGEGGSENRKVRLFLPVRNDFNFPSLTREVPHRAAAKVAKAAAAAAAKERKAQVKVEAAAAKERKAQVKAEAAATKKTLKSKPQNVLEEEEVEPAEAAKPKSSKPKTKKAEELAEKPAEESVVEPAAQPKSEAKRKRKVCEELPTTFATRPRRATAKYM